MKDKNKLVNIQAEVGKLHGRRNSVILTTPGTLDLHFIVGFLQSVQLFLEEPITVVLSHIHVHGLRR